MITADKIKIYARYNGDIDGWVRGGSKKERLTIADRDWRIIDSLVQDLTSRRNGLNSLEFNNVLDDRLKEICDGIDSINQLQKLALELK